MIVEHNYVSKEECKDITDWLDFNIGIDFEVTEADDGGEGSIVIFDLEPDEYQKFMEYLKEMRYI